MKICPKQSKNNDFFSKKIIQEDQNFLKLRYKDQEDQSIYNRFQPLQNKHQF